MRMVAKIKKDALIAEHGQQSIGRKIMFWHS